MLVLSRKQKQVIDILVDGKTIGSICVLRFAGSSVRLGLTGDQALVFRRRELSGRPPEPAKAAGGESGE